MGDFLLPYDLNTNTCDEGVCVRCKKSVHIPPHLHEAIEIIYITSGTVELGVGQELYHMEKGDFAVVFPNVIHHYQVFGQGRNEAVYISVEPSVLPMYSEELQKLSPHYPIIPKKEVPIDIENAVNAIVSRKDGNKMLMQAYVQVIFAHIFASMRMVEKEYVGGNDIVYKSVEYVAKNYNTEISLDKMAYDLGVSKYVLSRMFAKTFHCNFNQYINGVRLNYASSLLKNSCDSITNIYLDCGFESQRTFNRVFKERFKISPREYRKKMHVVNAQIK